MLIEDLSSDTHERIVRVEDAATGLIGFIAIHNTTLGPALGGCRFWPYATEQEALDDVLRLSRGMTFKNILAGLPHGGGKAVIIGDPKTDKSPALLRAFGQAMESLKGQYTTGEDVGVTVQDMEFVRSETRYVAGLHSGPAASGDPSPITACGVISGMQTALQHRLGARDFNNVRVAVQGLGHVGLSLCKKLHRLGAQLTVADIDAERVAEAAARFNALSTHPADISQAPADIFAPCALGGALTHANVDKLHAPIIAGSANNQLQDDQVGDRLWERGILYAPDYVINAGGVINVAAETSGCYDKRAVMSQVGRIGSVLHDIFTRAENENRSPHRIADEIAIERLNAAKRLRPAA